MNLTPSPASSLSAKVLGGFKRKNSTTGSDGGSAIIKKKFKTGGANSTSSACSTPPVCLSAADDPYSFDEEEKGNSANPLPSSAEFSRFVKSSLTYDRIFKYVLQSFVKLVLHTGLRLMIGVLIDATADNRF